MTDTQTIQAAIDRLEEAYAVKRKEVGVAQTVLYRLQREESAIADELSSLYKHLSAERLHERKLMP